MADVTNELLKTQLRQLRLPTMGREFERLARDAASSNQTFAQFLLRLTELELATRATNAVATRSRTPDSRSRRTSTRTTSARCRTSPSRRSWSWLGCEWIAQKSNCCLVGSHGTGETSPSVIPLWSRRNARGKSLSPIPVIPLFGKTFKLSGLARLPGHVRHCQVEVLPGLIAYIPVACTDLSTEPRPEPTVLTVAAVEALLAAFQAVRPGRRGDHAADPKPARLGTPAQSERDAVTEAIIRALTEVVENERLEQDPADPPATPGRRLPAAVRRPSKS